MATRVELGPGVDAWFTDAADGNLSHRRPHVPAQLARDRARVMERIDLEPDGVHLMRQVHGVAVATVDAATPAGAELDAVDAIVTAEVDRPLAVQVADCVPVLLASAAGVAAVHVGRRGLSAGVVPAALATLATVGGAGATRAAIGPAIGGCCYEVDAATHDDVVAAHPAARATTRWGTPSLDLPRAVAVQLEGAGVTIVAGSPGCTRCDPRERWFSHRRDPRTGRQLGLIVRRSARAAA